MGLLSPCFVSGGGDGFCTLCMSRRRIFASFESCPLGLLRGGGMVSDLIEGIFASDTLRV